MPISTLATLNSAQSINLRSKIQLSQDANSFKNKLAKVQEFIKKDFRLVWQANLRVNTNFNPKYSFFADTGHFTQNLFALTKPANSNLSSFG